LPRQTIPSSTVLPESTIPQTQKDLAKILNLQQEVEVARREKRFIQEKLNEVLGNPDKVRETEKLLQAERTRCE